MKKEIIGFSLGALMVGLGWGCVTAGIFIPFSQDQCPLIAAVTILFLFGSISFSAIRSVFQFSPRSGSGHLLVCAYLMLFLMGGNTGFSIVSHVKPWADLMR